METMASHTPDGRQPRLWTRAEYDRMAEAGILTKEDHVELIEGEILVMSPEGPVHVAEIGACARELATAFGLSYWVRLGNPFVVDDRSEPEPDLLVVPGEPRDYLRAHPTPEDAALVVEVSNTSLGFDLGRKLRLYARARVPEYWVIDIAHGCVHVYRNPREEEFLSNEDHRRGAAIRPTRAASSVEVSKFLFDEV